MEIERGPHVLHARQQIQGGHTILRAHREEEHRQPLGNYRHHPGQSVRFLHHDESGAEGIRYNEPRVGIAGNTGTRLSSFSRRNIIHSLQKKSMSCRTHHLGVLAQDLWVLSAAKLWKARELRAAVVCVCTKQMRNCIENLNF